MSALFLLVAGIIRTGALLGLGAWFFLHLFGPALVGGRLWASNGAFWLLVAVYWLARFVVWIYEPKVQGEANAVQD